MIGIIVLIEETDLLKYPMRYVLNIQRDVYLNTPTHMY